MLTASAGHRAVAQVKVRFKVGLVLIGVVVERHSICWKLYQRCIEANALGLGLGNGWYVDVTSMLAGMFVELRGSRKLSSVNTTGPGPS